MRITQQLLRDNQACKVQVALFTRHYPDGVRLTLKGLAAARRVGLDTGWLATLLSPTAQAGFNRAVDAVWTKHVAAISQAPWTKPIHWPCERKSPAAVRRARYWRDVDRALVAAFAGGDPC